MEENASGHAGNKSRWSLKQSDMPLRSERRLFADLPPKRVLQNTPDNRRHCRHKCTLASGWPRDGKVFFGHFTDNSPPAIRPQPFAPSTYFFHADSEWSACFAPQRRVRATERYV